MTKTYIAVTLLVVSTVGVALGAYYWPNAPTANQNTQEPTVEAPNDNPTGKYMGIEAYVTYYLSELSPVKEQVGGTFYVTKLEITGTTTGVVEYEDGHNAYVADFVYAVDAQTAQPQVTSFTIRE